VTFSNYEWCRTNRRIGPTECIECGADIPPRSGRSKYCSKSCQQLTIQRRKRERARALKAMDEGREITHDGKFMCLQCGSPIEEPRKRKYCSRRCHLDFENAKRRAVTQGFKGRPPVSECRVCGEEIPSERRNFGTSSCSDSCSHILRQRSQRDSRLRKMGISFDDYLQRLIDSDNRCEVCHRHAEETGGALHVDHHHATGRFRGLLCRACNTAEGLLRGDPNVMLRLAIYVESFHDEGGSSEAA